MYDYDKYGLINYSGKLTELSGFEAVSQAVNNWLYVALSERIMYPEDGNNLLYYIGKKMNDETIREISRKISSGLSEDFGNYMTVLYSKVTPVDEENTLVVEVAVNWQQEHKTITTNLELK